MCKTLAILRATFYRYLRETAGAGVGLSFKHRHPVQPQQPSLPLFQAPAKARGFADDKVSRLEAHLCYLDVPQRRAPKDLQEILGHAQITLTLDTYCHVLPSMQEGAVGRLGELLD